MGEYRRHLGKKKQRMSKRQKRKLLMLNSMLVIMILLLGIFFLTEKNSADLDEQELTSRQLSSFMSFYEYDEQQWYEFLLQQGMQEKVTWNGLEQFLQSLGVKKYLDYERPDQDRVVTYGEFQSLYDQILSILDGDKSVVSDTITIEKIVQANDRWDSGTATADGKTFQILTGAGQYKKGKTYVLYISGQRILGIIAAGIKKIEESGTMLPDLSDNDTVTVLLKNGNTAYRQKIYLLLKGDFTKTERSGKQKVLESGYLLKLTDCEEEQDPKEDKYLTLMPADDSCRIFFADKKGKKLSQGYRGEFRIYRYPGGYVVVNALSIREYLYGVVPSEMPSDYDEEALKAQAVCARSYAYQHLQLNQTTGFYADLDDTVQFQVYNKSLESESTRKAVEETANQVLAYAGKLAVTYYYSTSCGVTQGYDIWGLDKKEYGYLTPAVVHKNEDQILGEAETDLSTEESFRDFLKEDTEGFYEEDCRYFRWKAGLSYKENADELGKAVMQRKKAVETSVILLDEKGKSIADIKELGNPKKLKVKKRSIAGGITNLVIEYEKGSVELTTEYTIRYCLGACRPTVDLKDGSKISPELLPSACFYISSQKNGRVTLTGGGFGHGLGMSQNGADRLAKDGWSYKDILQFFYHGVELVEIVQ